MLVKQSVQMFIVRVKYPIEGSVILMKVTYIYHSGFLVELENTSLLFDYYKGDIPNINPDLPLYVFSSHSHGDHFSKDIFNLADIYPKVTFILSSDIKEDLSNKKSLESISDSLVKYKDKVYFIDTNERKLFNDGNTVSEATDINSGKYLKVETLTSTDKGVAFIVSTGGKVIFHAGDLHWWTWEGETKQEYQDMTDRFFAEVAKISQYDIDLAFLALDPRQEDRFYWGFDYFLNTCKIKHAVPMHFWEDFSIIPKFKQMAEAQSYSSKIIDIEKDGQSFVLD